MRLKRVGRALRGLQGARGRRGFTLPEVVVTMAALTVIVLAASVSYVGTLKSWDGTSSMTRLQRESSLAVETMSRVLRGAESVVINVEGDSLRVYYETAAGDSLADIFHINDDGQLVDSAGFVLSSSVDSLSFSTVDGKTVNMELAVTDGMGTEQCSDDQALLMSSTVVCRN
ncbi:MAG: prepilin-type N-terminal cleavage/methylation domain-containing protein [Candidatus Eisenbacteria bacterium]|nr:prepilin-type N-terminal cleavage/methylation domain-containing protein [Candidatus Eisenbacteria bacterium]